MAIQFPAIARLAELVSQYEYPSVAIAAVKDVLDRTLGKPIETTNLNVSGEIDVVTVLQRRRQRQFGLPPVSSET